MDSGVIVIVASLASTVISIGVTKIWITSSERRKSMADIGLVEMNVGKTKAETEQIEVINTRIIAEGAKLEAEARNILIDADSKIGVIYENLIKQMHLQCEMVTASLKIEVADCKARLKAAEHRIEIKIDSLVEKINNNK